MRIFPPGICDQLRALVSSSSLPTVLLFPAARDQDGSAEAAAIREGNRCSALGFAAAERLLRASRISAAGSCTAAGR
jgi:Xaa-Pro aminopeptidase